jgi:uncharacterized protein (TIGR02246 family)
VGGPFLEAVMSRSEIDALNTRFVQALERGDAAALAELYASDARLMPPGMPARTGDEIREMWAQFIGMGVNGGALKTLTLEEHDDVAIEVGEYEMRAGTALVDNGKYVVVHRRQPDGSWKLGLDIANSDRSPSSASMAVGRLLLGTVAMAQGKGPCSPRSTASSARRRPAKPPTDSAVTLVIVKNCGYVETASSARARHAGMEGSWRNRGNSCRRMTHGPNCSSPRSARRSRGCAVSRA